MKLQKAQQTTEGTWICICGKPCKIGEYCSRRCAYVAEMINSPLGQNMTIDSALRYFGKIYDRELGDDKE